MSVLNPATDHRPLDFNQITEHLWLGTNMCCQAHAATLLVLHFAADIDLEAQRPEAPPQTKIYLALPTLDQHAPTLEQLHIGVALLAALEKRGLKVYVHCKNGHGRAPTLVTAYFMASRGLDQAAAFELVRAKRPAAHLSPAQTAGLEAFKASL